MRLKEYDKKNIAPWEVKKSIIATAMEGYSYGSERGQIRMPSDHDHIVPLYSYGVDVYDFDMSKIKPLASLSQDEAENAVNNYFGIFKQSDE